MNKRNIHVKSSTKRSYVDEDDTSFIEEPINRTKRNGQLTNNPVIRIIRIMKDNDAFSYGMFNEYRVIIKNDDGYINATKLCKDGGKEFRKWKANANAHEFVTRLNDSGEILRDDLMQVIMDGKKYAVRGTYVHHALMPNIIEWMNKSKNKYPEKEIQSILHTKLGGKIEVPTIYGKIDLLTKRSIIEIKTYKNFLGALGQIIGYSTCYPDRQKKIYLFDVPMVNKIDEIKELYDAHDIKLIVYNYLK